MNGPVLIVEPNMTGHRPYYVRLLVMAALDMGSPVVVASLPGQFETEDARIHLHSIAGRFERTEFDDARLESIVHLSQVLGAAKTVVPDGDRFAIRLALAGAWRGAGELSVLIMRETAQPSRFPVARSAKSSLRRLLFRRAASLRNVQLVVLKSAWWDGASKFAVAHDPITLHRSPTVEERVTAEWGLDTERYWFATLGAISQRKNIALVAKALSDDDSSKIGFLVAGAWDESVGEEATAALDDLRASGALVVVVDRRLQDDELDAAVARVDCLVLAHSNEGPSGLLGKAAAAGTRVVAAGARSLREDLACLASLGSWVPLDSAALGAALRGARRQTRPAVLRAQESKTFTGPLLGGESWQVPA